MTLKKSGKKKIVIWAGACFLALVCVILICDILVTVNARGRDYDSVREIPHREVGLLLGTSPYKPDHGRNLYFEERIHTAADLYNAGKIDRLIVSGGDYTAQGGYDEPVAMRDSLMVRGVPEDKIVMDYDGTRTLKSLANMRDVFRTDSITIISQRYHNERALYQADFMGVDAIAINAQTPYDVGSFIKNHGREYLARVKLFIDLLSSRP